MQFTHVIYTCLHNWLPDKWPYIMWCQCPRGPKDVCQQETLSSVMIATPSTPAPMLLRTSLQFAKELLMLALVSQAVVNSIGAIAHAAFEIADPVSLIGHNMSQHIAIYYNYKFTIQKNHLIPYFFPDLMFCEFAWLGPPGGWVQSADVLHVLNTERYAERAVAMSRLLERFGGVSCPQTQASPVAMNRSIHALPRCTALSLTQVPGCGSTGACCARWFEAARAPWSVAWTLGTDGQGQTALGILRLSKADLYLFIHFHAFPCFSHFALGTSSSQFFLRGAQSNSSQRWTNELLPLSCAWQALTSWSTWTSLSSCSHVVVPLPKPKIHTQRQL